MKDNQPGIVPGKWGWAMAGWNRQGLKIGLLLLAALSQAGCQLLGRISTPDTRPGAGPDGNDSAQDAPEGAETRIPSGPADNRGPRSAAVAQADNGAGTAFMGRQTPYHPTPESDSRVVQAVYKTQPGPELLPKPQETPRPLPLPVGPALPAGPLPEGMAPGGPVVPGNLQGPAAPPTGPPGAPVPPGGQWPGGPAPNGGMQPMGFQGPSHQRCAPTATGCLLNMAPGESPVERLTEMTQKLGIAERERRDLEGRFQQLGVTLDQRNAILEQREKVMQQTGGEIQEAAVEVQRTLALVKAVQKEMEEMRAALLQRDKQDVETLKAINKLLERLANEKVRPDDGEQKPMQSR
jgi:hypothetical protein